MIEAIDGISVKDWEEKNIKSLLMDAGSFEGLPFTIECPFPFLLSVHMRTHTYIHVSTGNHTHAGHRCVHVRIRLQEQVDVHICACKRMIIETDAKRTIRSIYISTGAHGQAHSASESGLRC